MSLIKLAASTDDAFYNMQMKYMDKITPKQAVNLEHIRGAVRDVNFSKKNFPSYVTEDLMKLRNTAKIAKDSLGKAGITAIKKALKK